MNLPSDPREVALRLLEHARLGERDVDEFLERAVSVDYWRNLNPQLNVDGDLKEKDFENGSTDDEQVQRLVKKYDSEGYFQWNALLEAEKIKQMREGVEVLRHEGWPPIFAFVYDEFCAVWSTPSLKKLLSAILRPGYKAIPHHIWCHYVPVHARSSGWPPHIDGNSGRLTIWIALSDAKLDNGCMYLIPKNLTPERIAGGYPTIDAFSFKELGILLQSTRALPVPASSVLGWSDNVIHWGGSCTEPKEARISISLELAAEDCETNIDLLTSLSGPHALNSRLRVIGNAIGSYRRFEPLMVRYSALAASLKELKDN
jgi:hypothetical protein